MTPDTRHTYTKSDYKNFAQLAKIYNLDKEHTYDLLRMLYAQHMRFSYKSNKSIGNSAMVIKTSSTKPSAKIPLKLHPLAEEKFLETYDKKYPNERLTNKDTTKSTADKMNDGQKRLMQKQIDNTNAATKAYLAQKKDKGK